MTTRDLTTLKRMIEHGGRFVSTIAVAYCAGEDENRRNLLACFPHYFAKYGGIDQPERDIPTPEQRYERHLAMHNETVRYRENRTLSRDEISGFSAGYAAGMTAKADELAPRITELELGLSGSLPTPKAPYRDEPAHHATR